MAYPVPPDPRKEDDFKIIRNFDAIDFEDHSILNVAGTEVPDSLIIGEPVVYTSATSTLTPPVAYKIGTLAGNIVGLDNDFKFAGWVWCNFDKDPLKSGMPSANAIGRVPVAQRGAHRVRLLKSEYIYQPTSNNAYRYKGASETIAVGDDVVPIDCGATVHAKYACLKPQTVGNTGRYKAVGTNPTAEEEAANNRIDNCVIGKVAVIDGNYIEIEFNY